MVDYDILLRFGTYVGTLILILGVTYRYVFKHHKWVLGKALTLVVYSYFSGGAIVLIIKGFDYVFFNSKLLSSFLGILSDGESIALIAIGSLSGLAFVITFVVEFIKDTKKKPKSVKSRKNS